MNVAEIIGHQHLRILALEETIGARELEISLLKEKVMKLTPKIEPSCPLVGCQIVGPHSHEAKLGDSEPAAKATDDL